MHVNCLTCWQLDYPYAYVNNFKLEGGTFSNWNSVKDSQAASLVQNSPSNGDAVIAWRRSIRQYAAFELSTLDIPSVPLQTELEIQILKAERVDYLESEFCVNTGHDFSFFGLSSSGNYADFPAYYGSKPIIRCAICSTTKLIWRMKERIN